MSKPSVKPRVSREQWLRAALDLFSRVGERGLTIHQLAREVGVAKAGFYWHFRNRADLLEHLLDFWALEFTEFVAADSRLLELPPAERLLTIMDIVDKHNLTRYDVHFRAWAEHDEVASRRVAAVLATRLEMIRDLLAELGFEGEDLEMRAQTLVCYGSNERNLFGDFFGQSRRQRERNWRSLVELLLDSH